MHLSSIYPSFFAGSRKIKIGEFCDKHVCAPSAFRTDQHLSGPVAGLERRSRCTITEEVRNLVIIQDLDLRLWHQAVAVSCHPSILHHQFNVFIHLNCLHLFLSGYLIHLFLATTSFRQYRKNIERGQKRKSKHISGYPLLVFKF